MTANELIKLMNQMTNHEKNHFLDALYDEYFDKGIPIERILEEARIVEAYYNGELIESKSGAY